MTKQIIICLIQLSISSLTIGKNISAVELTKLNESAFSMININIDSGVLLAEQVKELALSNGYNSIAANSSYILGYLDEYQGKFDRATINYFECLRYVEGDESTYGVYIKVASLMNIGRIFYLHHLYTESIKYHKRGLEIANKYKRDQLICWLNYNLAMAYNKTGNYTAAIELLFESLKYAEKVDDYEELVKINRLLGLIFHEIGDFDKSREYYLQIFQYKGRVENFEEFAGRSSHNIGFTYFEERDFEKAEEYYNKAIMYRRKGGLEQDNFISYMDLGEMYLIQGLYKNAKSNYSNALNLGLDIYKDPDKFKIYKQLSRLHSELGNMEEFLKYDSIYEQHLEQYSQSKEQLLKTEQQFNLRMMMEQHEQVLASTQQTIAQQRTIMWLGGLLALMVVIFVSYFLWQQYLRRKRLAIDTSNQLMISELKALRSQINPHFLFNALHSIQNYVVTNDKASAEGYLNDFSRLMRNTLEHSDKMTIPVAEEVSSLELYIRMEQLRSDFKFDYEIKVDEQIDVYTTHIPAMVIQPFVENAIWHGLVPMEKRGKLEVSIEQDGDDIKIIVKDNGVGYSSTDLRENAHGKHQSAGMRLITERIGLLTNYFRQTFHLMVRSRDEGFSGTLVELRVPGDLI